LQLARFYLNNISEKGINEDLRKSKRFVKASENKIICSVSSETSMIKHTTKNAFKISSRLTAVLSRIINFDKMYMTAARKVKTIEGINTPNAIEHNIAKLIDMVFILSPLF